MNVNLDLRHRIIYWNMLSNFTSTNIATWRLLDEAKRLLGFSEEDYKKYGIKVQKTEKGAQFLFENEGTMEEYVVPDQIHEMVIEHLKDRDKQNIMAEDEFRLAILLMPES